MSLPHARGGVSDWLSRTRLRALSSPRSWGCFLLSAVCHEVYYVFPTLVGVFLKGGDLQRYGDGLPHARGGVSATSLFRRCSSRSSPRSWGCFQSYILEHLIKDVFPTLVGVFPSGKTLGPILSGLPHARGGVSCTVIVLDHFTESSPRSWGCF